MSSNKYSIIDISSKNFLIQNYFLKSSCLKSPQILITYFNEILNNMSNSQDFITPIDLLSQNIYDNKMYIYIYIYIFVCMCVYIYIYMYTW